MEKVNTADSSLSDSDPPFIFDPDSPNIKKDIIQILLQYLQKEGYPDSSRILQMEAAERGLFPVQEPSYPKQFEKIRKLILDGDWGELERLCQKHRFKNHKSFLYAMYRQQFLELVERQEHVAAYSVLSKRLKPLESRQSHPDELRALSYRLTQRSTGDSSAREGRQQLVTYWNRLVEDDSYSSPSDFPARSSTESRQESILRAEQLLRADLSLTEVIRSTQQKRLIQLLRKSAALQIRRRPPPPSVVPTVRRLISEFRPLAVPTSPRDVLCGHRGNVKSVTWGGVQGDWWASGSSDQKICLWRSHSPEPWATLVGHSSRVWDLAASRSGSLLASAAGDGTVRLWRIREKDNETEAAHTLVGHAGDVYTVRFHPDQVYLSSCLAYLEQHIVTGGYDKTIRLFDVRTGTLKKTFTGHNSSVSRVIFNPSGNLLISGSRDSTVKFWDISSGLCIKTIDSHLGEVTSVEINSTGALLLTGSKDNSNRLWETSTGRPIRRFKGHQNTSKNFVRCSFGPDEALIMGGSEDHVVYLWDIETGNILEKLRGHSGLVYSAHWNEQQSLLLTCSNDRTVRTWEYDPSVYSQQCY